MKTRYFLAGLFLMSLTLTSCSVDYGYADEDLQSDSLIAPTSNLTRDAVFRTVVRFETLDGQNVLSAFSDIKPDSGFVEYPIDYFRWLTAECKRESDGAQMTWSSTGLYFPDSKQAEEYYGSGPVLVLNWLDMDLRSGKLRPAVYDEAYTVRVRNMRMENAALHTIRWTIHVSGETYSIRRCEVDGMADGAVDEADADNDDKPGGADYIYASDNGQSGHYPMNNLIHLN